jgi:MFS family permease
MDMAPVGYSNREDLIVLPDEAEPLPVSMASESQGDPDPTAGLYAWYTVCVLMLIYTTSFIDRTIISLLVGPIKADLKLSDTQLSLLSGLSFAILYTALGIPFGQLADRYSRRTIICLGAITWSVMTASCGLAQGFFQLFLARVGVGIGEASLTPSAFSLIGDAFPRSQQAKAFGVYNMGITVGSGLALVLGGLIIDLVAKSPPLVAPVVGALKPWQTTFLAVAAPGFLLGLGMVTVREPRRRGLARDTGGQVQRPSTWRIIRYLYRKKRLYGPLYAGYSLYALVNFGFAAWIPTCLIRTFGWSAAKTGQVYGLAVLLLGTAGALGGGLLAARKMQAGDDGGYIKVTILAGLIVLPLSVLAPLAPNAAVSLALFGGAIFGNSIWLSGCGGSIQLIAPNQMRGQATAFLFLFSSMIGFGLGPLAIALLTDKVFGDDRSIKYSLAAVAAVVVPVALLIFRYVQPHFEREVADRRLGMGSV